MPKNRAVIYKKLPGKALVRGIFLGYHTLWLGNNHLLSVNNHGFAEDYKRFYFRDIQAISIQRTNQGKLWNSIWTILAGLSVLAVLGTEGYDGLPWLIISVICVVFLVINLARGPTCKCDIITAVQRETLPSLSRLRTANKVTRTLKRMIKKTQGEVNFEEVR